MAKFGLNKINNILILIIVVLTLLYIGEGFFKPLMLAFFFATLMKPVSNLFENWGLGRVFASFLCSFIVFLGVSGLLILLASQMAQFADDFPEMANQVEETIPLLQDRVADWTGISKDRQDEILQDQSEGIFDYLQGYIQGFLQNIFTTLGHFFLTLVYLFLFLIHRTKFKKIILSYIPEEKKSEGILVIDKSAAVSHLYLWGRLQVMTILGIMYYITFLSFGLEFALLFTVVGALLTVIPYIGPLLSGVLPVAFALIGGRDLSFILLFAAVVLVIQLIESYILEPLIIGKEVDLTPLFIIIAIIVGSMLWGILGMILFVPLFAILKILFEHINRLEPIGYLLRNEDDKSVS